MLTDLTRTYIYIKKKEKIENDDIYKREETVGIKF